MFLDMGHVAFSRKKNGNIYSVFALYRQIYASADSPHAIPIIEEYLTPTCNRFLRIALMPWN
jgi:hypothetical protein